MSLNGISNITSNYSKYDASTKPATKKPDKTDATTSSTKDTDAAVYEASAESSSTVKNAALIEQLKADTESRMAQMQSLVQKMFEKQGIAIGTADDMWKVLASGNFKADPETIAQAKKDTAEDGYWGVSQTSDRIFSFASALAGGDSEKMSKMKDAVAEGFKQATKSWGKSLPGISNDTYDAVMKKFDDWFGTETTTDTENTEA